MNGKQKKLKEEKKKFHYIFAYQVMEICLSTHVAVLYALLIGNIHVQVSVLF